MIIKLKTRSEKNEVVRKLHRWFAWYPVHITDGHWVWLQFIYRQGFPLYTENRRFAGYEWKYRLTEESTNQ